MKRKRYSPEQIIRKLREADRMLSEGQTIAEVCPQLEIVEATFHRWRNQYGGLKAARQLFNRATRNGMHPCATERRLASRISVGSPAGEEELLAGRLLLRFAAARLEDLLGAIGLL